MQALVVDFYDETGAQTEGELLNAFTILRRAGKGITSRIVEAQVDRTSETIQVLTWHGNEARLHTVPVPSIIAFRQEYVR